MLAIPFNKECLLSKGIISLSQESNYRHFQQPTFKLLALAIITCIHVKLVYLQFFNTITLQIQSDGNE